MHLSIKKTFVCCASMLLGTMALISTACGDDSSTSVKDGEQEISSSSDDLEDEESSSSVSKAKSSSSYSKHSSSSATRSSSSVKSINSSSGVASSSSKKSSGLLRDSRDGHVYQTVKIGDQVWMAENLNFNSNFLPKGASDSVMNSFCYNDESASCKKTGRLYLWSAAMDSAAIYSNDGAGCGFYAECSAKDTIRGVCPEGWHFPSIAEWKNCLMLWAVKRLRHVS